MSREISKPTAQQIESAQARKDSSDNSLILVTKVKDVPGVSHKVTVVADKEFPALGGDRAIENTVITKKYRSAVEDQPAYVDRAIGSFDIDDDVAPAAFEAWRLAGDMRSKYAVMHRIMRTEMATHPELFPTEMRDQQEAWLRTAALFGGVKTVTVIDNLEDFRNMTSTQRKDLNAQHADHFAELNALTGHETGYYTGPDMNTNEADKTDQHLYDSRYAVSYSEELGGSGNPSPITARGVAHSTYAVIEHLGIDPEKVAIGIQGVGAVGSEMVGLYKDRLPKSTLYIADTNDQRVVELSRQYDGVLPASLKDIHIKGDIFNPAATSGVITRQALLDMESAGVQADVPAANAPHEAGYERFIIEQANAAGIVDVPAYWANLGGIYNITREFAPKSDGHTPSREVAAESIAMMEPATRVLLETSSRLHMPPSEVAEIWALEEYANALAEKGLV